MSMKPILSVSFVVGMLAASIPAWSQTATGSMSVRWNEGAKDCTANPQPPIQVHPYNQQTFIIRENLCATFEAPFLYLLIGSKRALLIDDGDVADPQQNAAGKDSAGLAARRWTGKTPIAGRSYPPAP